MEVIYSNCKTSYTFVVVILCSLHFQSLSIGENDGSIAGQTIKIRVATDGGGGHGFTRSPEAKKFFAPRDLRKTASNGDLEKLKSFVAQKPEYIHRTDKNGWSPLHMAIRSGQTHIVEYLIEAGCDYNSPTKDGSLPLGIALDELGGDHPISIFLRTVGAFASLEEQQILPTDAEVVNDDVYDSYVEQGRSKLDKFFGGSEDDGGGHHGEL